jgi:hypothetical protein
MLWDIRERGCREKLICSKNCLMTILLVVVVLINHSNFEEVWGGNSSHCRDMINPNGSSEPGGREDPKGLRNPNGSSEPGGREDPKGLRASPGEELIS